MKRIRIDYHGLILVIECEGFKDLLLQQALRLNVDPATSSLYFSSPVKEFVVNERIYQILAKDLDVLSLRLECNCANRAFFGAVVDYYSSNWMGFSRNVKELYQAVLIGRSNEIKQIRLNPDLIGSQFKHFCYIIPFCQGIESFTFGISSKAKYSIGFLNDSLLGNRSSSLSKRLKAMNLNFESILAHILPANLFTVITSLNNLQHLDLSYSYDSGYRLLLEKLENSQLKSLNLSGCSLVGNNLIFLILSRYKYLEILEMNYVGLQHSHIIELDKETFLDKFSNLKKFSIRGNYLADIGLELGQSIGRMGSLESLDISECSLLENSFSILSYTLMACLRLKELYISNVSLSACFPNFLRLLDYLPCLTHLDISENHLTDQMLKSILLKLPNLILLDSTFNNCSNSTISFLPRTLQYLYFTILPPLLTIPTINLIELELSFTEFTVSPEVFIFVGKQSKLRVLTLNKIHIVEENIEACCAMFKAVEDLEVFTLNEAYCDYKCFKMVAEAIMRCPKIKVLGYSHEILSKEKMYLLCKVNSRNKWFRPGDNFAQLHESDLLPQKPACKKCKRHCMFEDICQWNRLRNFVFQRVKYNNRLI